jgi:quercetin dioxygenase-like cupin family protein
MNPDQPDPDSRILMPPSLLEAELEPLMAEPFVQAWTSSPQDVPGAVRGRLLQRLASSRAAEAPMQTVRRRQAPREALAPGVQAQWLFRTQSGTSPGLGEPLGARLVELEAGVTLPIAALDAPYAGARPCHREWLVLHGRVQDAVLGIELGPRDYHVVPAGAEAPSWRSDSGALLFLRESDPPAVPGDVACTVRDSEAGWPEFAPGIRRRVLWQRQGQAALLYLADPGALVPVHSHGHAEECLMLQGELFLDDLLLQPGDYQLAPAGTRHRITETDTGAVLYAHGDLDLQFVS